MTITLYNTASGNNEINKSLGTGVSESGAVRGDMNVVKPVIDITGDITGFNYAYIPDFGRYYYITESKVVREGITRLYLKSDPLMSFRDSIYALPAIASRVSGGNGELFNSYLHDEKMRLLSADICGTWVIHTFSYGNQYILVTAG